MLYKVTPNLTPQPVEKPARDPNAPKIARKKRRSAVYDGDGNEVLITMMCLKCRAMKPLVMFGLRKMADGAIRNQPWCRGCRSVAGVKKPVLSGAEGPGAEGPAELPKDSGEALEAVALALPPLETPGLEAADAEHDDAEQGEPDQPSEVAAVAPAAV